MFHRSILFLTLTAMPALFGPALGQGARVAEAQACFDQRLDQPADLPNRLAACLRVIGDSSAGADKRAEAHLRRAFAHAQKADQSQSKDDIDRALADLFEANRLAPNSPGVQKYVLETRAGLHLRNRTYDRAIADYTALLALEPRSAAVYAHRGIAHRALGKTSEAVADLRHALLLDPSNARFEAELRLAEAGQPVVTGAVPKGAADAGEIEKLKAQMRTAQEAAKAAEDRLAALEAKVSAPPDPHPAGADAAKLARDLQSELKRVGCDPGAIDAQWGQKTQQALQKFAEQTKLALPVREPTTAALDAVSARQGPVCSLACANHEIEAGGRCVARPAAKAQWRYRTYSRKGEHQSADRPAAGPPIGIMIGIGNRRRRIGIAF